MRGEGQTSGTVFGYIDLEDRVPVNDPPGTVALPATFPSNRSQSLLVGSEIGTSPDYEGNTECNSMTGI